MWQSFCSYQLAERIAADSPARQERDLNTDGDFADAGEVVYYHSSTIYSIFALSNTDESVVERYRHTAYGETTVLDADGTEDTDGLSDVENPYLFQSRRLEVAAGVMQFRHREYAPDLGRFLQRDPSGYHSWHNPYAYVLNSPSSSTDPTGLRTLDRDDQGHVVGLSFLSTNSGICASPTACERVLRRRSVTAAAAWLWMRPSSASVERTGREVPLGARVVPACPSGVLVGSRLSTFLTASWRTLRRLLVATQLVS